MYSKMQVDSKKTEKKNFKEQLMQKKVLKTQKETTSSQKLKFQTLETKKMVKIKNRNLKRSLHQMKGTVMKMKIKEKSLLLKIIIKK